MCPKKSEKWARNSANEEFLGFLAIFLKKVIFGAKTQKIAKVVSGRMGCIFLNFSTPEVLGVTMSSNGLSSGI